MEPKPLLFPFLYDVQEAAELSESTSIYDAPVLRERLKKAEGELSSDTTVSEGAGGQKGADEQVAAKPVRKPCSIALKNRKLVKGVVLRNEFAKLLVETKDGPQWIPKSQIMQIYE